jgi:hypothetical protein
MNTSPIKPIGFRPSQPWGNDPRGIGWTVWIGSLIIARTPGIRPGIHIGWTR